VNGEWTNRKKKKAQSVDSAPQKQFGVVFG
jgi:hypothetical protein